jgi:hypothetical protein
MNSDNPPAGTTVTGGNTERPTVNPPQQHNRSPVEPMSLCQTDTRQLPLKAPTTTHNSTSLTHTTFAQHQKSQPASQPVKQPASRLCGELCGEHEGQSRSVRRDGNCLSAAQHLSKLSSPHPCLHHKPWARRYNKPSQSSRAEQQPSVEQSSNTPAVTCTAAANQTLSGCLILNSNCISRACWRCCCC